jgi:hypothetical protein
MKISNIRLGHATNSSSSHSIIIVPPDTAIPSTHSDYEGEYGWENFLLTDSHSKLAYLAACVGNDLVSQYGESIAYLVMRDLFPDHCWTDDWYVDHASCIDLPLDARTRQPSLQLLKELKEYLQRQDIVIMGNHDSDGYYPLSGTPIPYPVTAAINIDYVALKSDHWWTLYYKPTGAKIRFSFHDNPPELLRSSAPELIDMKITDYCEVGCKYCYQDSTKQGVHAPLKKIKEYIDAAANSGVFEIALGGGEPTTHPNFVEILKYAHDKGITPNFTTKVLPSKWSGELLNATRKYVGAFAVSISNSWDVEELAAAALLTETKAIAQCVVGVPSDWQMKSIIEQCQEEQIALTLLGYKEVGRGKSFSKRKQAITPELLESAWKLSVDTAFVEQYSDVLDEVGIETVLRVPGEGRFSMYVDVVAEKAGISSYHADSFIDFGPPWWSFDEIWEKLL